MNETQANETPKTLAKTEYAVVRNGNMNDLIREVNAYAFAGWAPTGGIAVTDNHFYQAVVRCVAI